MAGGRGSPGVVGGMGMGLVSVCGDCYCVQAELNAWYSAHEGLWLAVPAAIHCLRSQTVSGTLVCCVQRAAASKRCVSQMVH